MKLCSHTFSKLWKTKYSEIQKKKKTCHNHKTNIREQISNWQFSKILEIQKHGTVIENQQFSNCRISKFSKSLEVLESIQTCNKYKKKAYIHGNPRIAYSGHVSKMLEKTHTQSYTSYKCWRSTTNWKVLCCKSSLGVLNNGPRGRHVWMMQGWMNCLGLGWCICAGCFGIKCSRGPPHNHHRSKYDTHEEDPTSCEGGSATTHAPEPLNKVKNTWAHDWDRQDCGKARAWQYVQGHAIPLQQKATLGPCKPSTSSPPKQRKNSSTITAWGTRGSRCFKSRRSARQRDKLRTMPLRGGWADSRWLTMRN